jgi:hypothetical protein
VTWLALLGAVCAGCAKKEQPELPNVELDVDKLKPVDLRPAPPDPLAGKVNALNYATLWDPAQPAKVNVPALVKTVNAERYFTKHQTEYRAAATVGTMAGATHSGPCAFVVPLVLDDAYPKVAKQMEATWADRLVAAVSPSATVIDVSNTVFGGASVRVLVLRAKNGADEELATRFDEYLTRLEAAVKGTGVTIIGHQRGVVRPTGSLSDVRYEMQTRAGYVRSVLVRAYDPLDQEVIKLMFGDSAAVDAAGMFKSTMSTEKGPFLVIALKEQPR